MPSYFLGHWCFHSVYNVSLSVYAHITYTTVNTHVVIVHSHKNVSVYTVGNTITSWKMLKYTRVFYFTVTVYIYNTN